jgi:streptogramin lyase
MGRSRRLLLAALALALAAGAPAARAGVPVGIAESFPTKCAVGELAIAAEGGAWFSCFNSTESGYSGRATVGRVSPSGQVTEFGGPFPKGGGPGDVAVAADGSFWMALESLPNTFGKQRISPRLARVTPSGEASVFPLELGDKESIYDLVAAPSGYLWFVTAEQYVYANPVLWQISPAGEISRVPVTLTPNRSPGLLVGAEGDLWFTTAGAGAGKAPFFRLTPGGTPVEVGGGINGFTPGLPALAPDGSIWFLAGNRKLAAGRVTPSGEVIGHVADVDPGDGSIGGAVAGADGSLWFGVQGYRRSTIGQVTTGGKVNLFHDCLTYSQPYFGPATFVRGAEGDLWFTSVESRELPGISDPPSIGRVTAGGQITQIFAGVVSEPRTIAAGPEGGAWFGAGGDEVQRIQPITGEVNTFRVGRVLGTRRDGRSTVRVKVPSPGKLVVEPVSLQTGRRLKGRVPLHGKPVTASAAACGSPAVPVRPVGAALGAFRKHGSAVETVAVTFTPRGGTPHTEEATLSFRRPRR